MKPVQVENRPTFKSALKATSNLYFAQLVRPLVRAKATACPEIRGRQIVGESWMLCGDVSSEMFARLARTDGAVIPTRLSAFNSNFGGAYGVVTHQMGDHQHRFVLCLYDPEVREFLASATKEKFGFMLRHYDEMEAVVITSPIKGVEFTPLLAMSVAASVGQQQKEVVMELPMVISAMTNPLQVPSIFRGQTVKEVSVSVLLPSALGSLSSGLNAMTAIV
jgi:hypothetical protein